MLTWDEIEIERDQEDGCGCGFVRHHDINRDQEVMNGRTARRDAVKDHNGTEWSFAMEGLKRRTDRSARP